MNTTDAEQKLQKLTLQLYVSYKSKKEEEVLRKHSLQRENSSLVIIEVVNSGNKRLPHH